MLSHTTSDNPPLTIICIYHQESKQVQRLKVVQGIRPR